MDDTNSVLLIGRLTRDAELKYLSSGTAVCKFAIASNRSKKQGDSYVDEVSYFDIVLWGKSGEALNQYLVKGKQVAITGNLHQNRWEQDGQARSKIEVMAENVQLLGGGKDSAGESGGERYTKDNPGQGKNPAGAANQAAASSDGFEDGYPDEIGF